jgi:hypothetical protein
MTPTNPISRNSCIRSLFVCTFAFFSLATAKAASSELESLTKEAGRNFETKEGQRYLEQFEKAIMPVFSKALSTCSSSTPDTKEPASIVVVVAANGTIQRLLYSTDIPFGNCLGSKLRAIKTVPKPPRDAWAVALGAANHFREERAKTPRDKPVIAETEEKLAAYDRAIAPYVAKARATYPDAKRRFLAGLPSGYHFSVRVPLVDRDGKREDSFIGVENISGGKITGTVNSRLTLISDYKTGQRITFSETKIDNWVIVRPDGTEEGNAVGKFLDTYKRH